MKDYSNMTRLELEQELQTLRAEERTMLNREADPLAPAVDEIQHLIHTLKVRHVELEMQNRELYETHRLLEETRDRYANLYDFAPVGYLSLDHQGVIQEINLTAAAMLGIERPLLLGMPLIAFVAKRDTGRVLEHLQQCTQRGNEKVVTELGLKVKGGDLISVRLESLQIHSAEPQATTFRTALIDLTALKQAEETLRESEARFRQMADAAPIMIWMSSTDKLCDYFNKPWLDFTGRTLEQELGNGWTEGIHPDDLAHCLEIYTTSFDARRNFRMEYRLRRYDGEYRWLLDIGVPRLAPDGHFAGYIGSCLDITERKHAEAALRDSEARAAGIIGSAMDAIITTDADQRILVFNAAAERMFQSSAVEAIGLPLDRFIPERFRSAHRQHIVEFGHTSVTKRSMGSLGAVFGLRASGEEFPIEASISQIEAGGQKLFTVILRDVTERRRTEERLIEHAALLNHARDAILVCDLDDRIHFWNQGAKDIYGWTAEEAIGLDPKELIFGGDASQFAQTKRAVIERGEWRGELRQVAKNGREIITESRCTLVRDTSGNPKSILAINTDVTEQKKLEAQFLRAQRLESIGTLASGIAHDLNNVLSPIMMAAQMLQLKITDESSKCLLELMVVNAQRGSELVKQVLSFARGAAGQKKVLQPKHLIKEIAKVVSETFPKNITIKHSLPPDLATINGDPTQLHQVLMNLCVNARDAMPQGGVLTIAAENVDLDEHYTRMNPEAKPGPYVLITVTDTGIGIPHKILDRIFDPFFTTKEQGEGTGLGLSTVLGIVKNHGGFINVYSEPGKGTQFSIYLASIASEHLAQDASVTPNLLAGHNEMILVVDDEEAVRETVRTTLEAFGYRVLTACDGPEAVALYVMHKEDIEAVLIDMMMPLMDGLATTRVLQRINPEVKVILSSGLAESKSVAEA
ncbi:MAG: PAS domain S-box protein, partial [Acidobacteria bacterium]|nr:PAS domain S-box protein [Acidobacteriota bacterium]